MYERCEVHRCCTAAGAAAVNLLYSADAFEIQRKHGFELYLAVLRMARPHNTRAHTQNHRS